MQKGGIPPLWQRGVNNPLDRPAWEGAAGLLDPSATHFIAGAKIDWYVIEAPLGEGGMGVVYRGRDTKLNRPVAIKFLSTHLADVSARRRFQREAQMASALNHPHIVTVYDVGEFEGHQYLVTEFVDGGTLSKWAHGIETNAAKSGAERREWRKVVELLTGVAEGLAVAHTAGILHRDIKPDNILVFPNGYAKLADFGLAKLAERLDVEAASTLTEGHTRFVAFPTLPGAKCMSYFGIRRRTFRNNGSYVIWTLPLGGRNINARTQWDHSCEMQNAGHLVE